MDRYRHDEVLVILLLKSTDMQHISEILPRDLRIGAAIKYLCLALSYIMVMNTGTYYSLQ